MRGFCGVIAGAIGLSLASATFGAINTSSISANFNNTSIADTRYIWFNAHVKSVTGNVGPVDVYIKNQHITLSGLLGSYDLTVPDGHIQVDPANSPASLTFTGSEFLAKVPNDNNDPFFAGLVWDVPTGEDPKGGNANPVVWSGDFYASQTGVQIQWQWTAAVYTSFSTNYNSLGIAGVDGTYQSGTPANYTAFVTGGAMGGGGSNYTGSNSGTETIVASLIPANLVPEPASLGILALGALGLLRRRR